MYPYYYPHYYPYYNPYYYRYPGFGSGYAFWPFLAGVGLGGLFF